MTHSIQASPAALTSHRRISPKALKAALSDGVELAVLDVRENGLFSQDHLLYASNAPLWRLELVIDRLVPRRETRIVIVDADESLADQAASKLLRLGWSNTEILAGGTKGWSEAGIETFSGTNVPSKILGELIEVQKHTPWIDVHELHERVNRGENLVVVDSRSSEEFTNFSLPFAQSAPGGEILLRIGDIAPDPDTLVVVNCAGRTRSIVGAQTLIDAGIPNKVVSLQNGTMEWLMAGHALAYGRPAVLTEPSAGSLLHAQALAQELLLKTATPYITSETLWEFENASDERTLYKFDIRTREEYQTGHQEGWRWAPGGQLVQATDEFLATRHARIVIADWDGVRALTTAAWLVQLGGYEIYLYKPESGIALVTGEETVKVQPPRLATKGLRPNQANQLIQHQGVTVFDVDKRRKYEKLHIPGAYFSTPQRLVEFLSEKAPAGVIITSSDGVLAQTVASELAWISKREVRYILGGTRQWIKDGLPTQTGSDNVLTGEDDQAISPYVLRDLEARNTGFRTYLDWELGLVEQLERDGSREMKLI